MKLLVAFVSIFIIPFAVYLMVHGWQAHLEIETTEVMLESVRKAAHHQGFEAGMRHVSEYWAQELRHQAVMAGC